MSKLSQQQITSFWKNGYLVVPKAVTDFQLCELRNVFNSWLKESRSYQSDYGETLDGRPRFDLEPKHSAEHPMLRRVQSPEEVSDSFADVMRNANTVDFVSSLIGPAIRFHHGKVNSKLPGAATEVKYHQDFTFQPMTNDDVITALLFIDEVTTKNGPLEVVPKSHLGPLYPLWHDGVFTGAVADDIYQQNKHKAIICTGKAGSVCLMHSNLLHGSAPNLSDESRTIYIATYYAEDAIELSPNALPSTLTHELIRGEPSGRIRCSSYEMLLPEVPKETSFFSQQAKIK